MASNNLDQERAAYAWEMVADCSDKYADLAKSAPALVMNNGLMQTLAFLQDKSGSKKDHHAALAEHICEWLKRHCGVAVGDASYKGVMEGLFKANPALYRRATDETLALLRWIRQFAAAINFK